MQTSDSAWHPLTPSLHLDGPSGHLRPDQERREDRGRVVSPLELHSGA